LIRVSTKPSNRTAAQKAVWEEDQLQEIRQRERLASIASGAKGLVHTFQLLIPERQETSRTRLLKIFSSIEDAGAVGLFSPTGCSELKERFAELHLAGTLVETIVEAVRIISLSPIYEFTDNILCEKFAPTQ
jgi:hypothetical protein